MVKKNTEREYFDDRIKKKKSARQEMKAPFPKGIKLTPPKDRRRGPWRADLKLDGSNVLLLDTYRRGSAEGSRPITSKPPGGPEGSEFTELSLGSGCKT